jgi:hypothetical protein
MFNYSIRTGKIKNPTWDDPLAPSDTVACPGLPSAQRNRVLVEIPIFFHSILSRTY